MTSYDWDFGVEALPVQAIRKDGTTRVDADQFRAIVHETKPIVYYIGSDRYLPVSHRDLMRPIMERIDLALLDLDVILTKDGGRMYTTIMHKQPKTLPQMGDIRFGVKVVNSLDGSRRLEIHTVLTRVVCGNGMVATKILGGFKRRHLQSTEVDIHTFVEEVKHGLNNLPLLDSLNKLLKPMSISDFDSILEKIELPKKYNELAHQIYNMPEVTSITPEERNTLWGGYNIVTYILTHEADKMSIDRRHDFAVALDGVIAGML